MAVKQFRKIEQKRVVLSLPTEIYFHFHALCLHGLLTIGGALVIASKRFDSDELARFQVRHEQIEAYVEEMEQSLGEWHHGFSEADLKAVREAIFGVKT